jgi:signal transduction histidine kinase
LSEFLDAYLESEVIERNRRLSAKHREELSLLAQRAVERAASKAAAKTITMAEKCEPGIYVESADPDHLLKILENLIANAIDIAPVGGHIAITAVQRARSVEIEVIDQDMGFLSVSVDAASTAFRWIQSPGIEIQHDGLGLAFAKHAVEIEGGLLNIQDYGQGLIFNLQFPGNSNN